MEVLRPDLEAKYTPWTYTTVKNAYRKINSIYWTLSRYASRVELPSAPRPVRQQAQPEGEGTSILQSRIQGNRSHAQSTATAHVDPYKRNIKSSSAFEPCQKCRKEVREAMSYGSVLIHVDRRQGRKEDAISDFEKFAKAQNDFWKECKGCYLFCQQSHTVDIAQCVLAKEKYIIRRLQTKIVKSVKNELVQMGDEKMWQKVCLTPIDKDGKLLREKPKSWNEIKFGKFMIINGQHNITMSKEL